ncbi:hypothetical protein [Chitinimonas naiadis]
MLVKVYQGSSHKIFLPKDVEFSSLPESVRALAGDRPEVRNTVLEEDTGVMGVDVSQAIADIGDQGYHIAIVKVIS